VRIWSIHLRERIWTHQFYSEAQTEQTIWCSCWYLHGHKARWNSDSLQYVNRWELHNSIADYLHIMPKCMLFKCLVLWLKLSSFYCGRQDHRWTAWLTNQNQVLKLNIWVYLKLNIKWVHNTLSQSLDVAFGVNTELEYIFMLHCSKNKLFLTFFTLLQHLPPQSGLNMPILMKPLLPKYKMCCDW